MQMVKESLNEGYCDISGHPTDMTVVGEYTAWSASVVGVQRLTMNQARWGASRSSLPKVGIFGVKRHCAR